LVNIGASATLQAGKQPFELNIQLNNALNTKYYDHTSFYRLIEVPGQGRNLVVTLEIPFNKD
jgi:iron complex outermembrane receptor protein